jgi:hypothetical protein
MATKLAEKGTRPVGLVTVETGDHPIAFLVKEK